MTDVEKQGADPGAGQIQSCPMPQPKRDISDPLLVLQQPTPSGSRGRRKSTFNAGVEMPELSSSEGGGKPYGSDIEQVLRKNEEILKKRSSAESSTKGDLLDLVQPRTVFMFKKLQPKKLILWSPV